MVSRRRFLAAVGVAGLGLVMPKPAAALVRGRRSLGPHPVPRPGITADKLPTREQLADSPRVADIFDAVREIPEIVDGIRCHCGCADSDDFYSLLTCYETTDAMARACPICQGQGRLAARLHKDGKTLDEIRVAIDARYG